MCEAFNRQILRLAVAQICQSMGWDGLHKSTHEVLTNTLQKYMEEIAKTTKEYSQLFCRTEPTLDDLGSAFSDLGVFLHELEDYVTQVDPVPFLHSLPELPVYKPQQLNHPLQQEDITDRPHYYHDYLPLIIEQKEEKLEEVQAIEEPQDAPSNQEAEDVMDTSEKVLSPVRQDIKSVKRLRESFSPNGPDSKRIKTDKIVSPIKNTEDTNLFERLKSPPPLSKVQPLLLDRKISEPVGICEQKENKEEPAIVNLPEEKKVISPQEEGPMLTSVVVPEIPPEPLPSKPTVSSPKITSPPLQQISSPVSKKPASPRITSPKATAKILSPTKRKNALFPKASGISASESKKVLSPPPRVKPVAVLQPVVEKSVPKSPQTVPKVAKTLPVKEATIKSPPKSKVSKPLIESEPVVNTPPKLIIKPIKSEPVEAIKPVVVKKPVKKSKKQKPKTVKDIKIKEEKKEPPMFGVTSAPSLATNVVPTLTVSKIPHAAVLPSSSWTQEEDSPPELTIDLGAKPKSSKKKKKKENEGKIKKKEKVSKSKHVEPVQTTSSQVPIPKIKFKLDPSSSKPTGHSSTGPAAPERTVSTTTLYNTLLVPGSSDVYYCPKCNLPDDGSPMIGCDGCDEWYHWPCVGITSAPGEDIEWYCKSCQLKKTKKKKKKKDKDKARKQAFY